MEALSHIHFGLLFMFLLLFSLVTEFSFEGMDSSLSFFREDSISLEHEDFVSYTHTYARKMKDQNSFC